MFSSEGMTSSSIHPLAKGLLMPAELGLTRLPICYFIGGQVRQAGENHLIIGFRVVPTLRSIERFEVGIYRENIT
ncbi:MAG: hypothetical protein KJ666_07435 [Bacteroidetes bacterium]|nr:hypothetical protein [Bacteroidota bacterium]MBU2585776.1 hypothetical protein [Bacteroidota bacterium]